jgi:hypothetical protein
MQGGVAILRQGYGRQADPVRPVPGKGELYDLTCSAAGSSAGVPVRLEERPATKRAANERRRSRSGVGCARPADVAPDLAAL